MEVSMAAKYKEAQITLLCFAIRYRGLVLSNLKCYMHPLLNCALFQQCTHIGASTKKICDFYGHRENLLECWVVESEECKRREVP